MINTRLSYWVFGWAFLLLLIFLYASDPSQFYFANDDFIHVPLSGNKNFGQTYLFRPVSEFTLYIDYQLWEKNATGYHLTNLILHLLDVIVVFYFSRRLLALFTNWNKEQLRLISFITATLFMVYPFHVEAIYWIVGRGALLGCLFALLSLHFLLKSTEKRFYIMAAAVSFIAGLLAYEIIFVVPLMAVILKVFAPKEKKHLIPSWLSIFLFWIIFTAFLVYRYGIHNTRINDHEAGNFIHFNAYQLLYNLAAFFTRSFTPPLESSSLFVACFVTGLLALLLSLYYVFRFKKYHTGFFVTILLLFLLALVPVLSPGVDTHTTEADRFLYLPSVFFLIGCVTLTAKIFVVAKQYVWPFAIISVYFMICTVVYAGHYKHAGQLAQQSLAAINKQGQYKDLYAIDLPSQYKGATIFRNGFDYALKWMCPQLKFDSLHIVSKKSIQQKVEHLISNENSYQEWKQDNKESLPGYSQDRDLILSWTDSSLTTIKKK